MVILRVILGVILTVVYVILMTEIVLGDDSYDKSCDPRGDPGRDLIFWKCLSMKLTSSVQFLVIGNVYHCN